MTAIIPFLRARASTRQLAPSGVDGVLLFQSCSSPTAVSIRPTKLVSQPACVCAGQENTRFILDVVSFNRALMEWVG